MSIDSALQTAVDGLRAVQAQIQVVSGNIANVQTPGYSREILPQETVVTPGVTTVATGAVQRVVNQVLNDNLLAQTTTASAASARSNYLSQIENLFGTVSNGATINTALSNFSNALQAVATTPTDPVAQGAAVAAGQTLARQLNQVSSGIQNIRQTIDGAINTDVNTLNTSLQSIATINEQISQLQAEGQSTAALQDQRDQALNQVAQLIGVSSFIDADGSMVVTTSTGQTLVDAGGAGTLSYAPSGNVSASTVLSGIKLNGVDITSQLTTGEVGAMLQLRDVALPGYTAQLNQFTDNLFNAAQVASSTASITNSGGNPVAGDTFTATVDGVSYTTLPLPANPTLQDVANALNTQFNARTTIPVGGGAPQAGDTFVATIDGTPYTTAALAGAGPFTTTDIVNALNAAIPANFRASVNGGGNIVIADTSGAPITASLALTAGTGTETFAAAVTNTLSASLSGGNLVLSDSTGNPVTATIATNPMFTAGAPNNAGTPTTIDFSQTSSSINVGQTFDVVIDGTDFGSTTALATGATSLTDVAAAIQSLFTAKGSSFTASVVAGKIRIGDPVGNPITASITLSGGPGSESFALQTSGSTLNTLNSGLNATNDANHFFADVNLASGIDNASTIQVNPSLLANAGLLFQGAGGPDPSISQRLLAGLGGDYTFSAAGSFTNPITTTLGDYGAQIVGGAATDSAAAQSDSTFQTNLQSQLATQAQSVSGVNIDEELGNLVQYQNAYGANARVLTVIQELFNTLMQI